LIASCAGSEVDPPGSPGTAGTGGAGDSGQAGSTPAGGASGGQGNAAGQGPAGAGGSAGAGGPAGAGGSAGAGGEGAAGSDGGGGRGGGAGGRGGASAGGRGGAAGAGGAAGVSGRGGASGGSSGLAGRGGTTGAGGALEYVGNITTANAVDTDGKIFSRHWNQISPENAGKWGSVQSSAGAAFNWRTLDAIYDYTEQNGIIFKEHTFIWGSQQPSGSLTETHVKTWMTEFCRRYPNTKIVDVVNEPPPHTTPSYVNAIGGGTNGTWQWITNAFMWAHQACPNAVLVLNDFNNIEWSGDNSHFVSIVRTIKAAGAPIDAVGAQAHDLDHGQVTVNTVRTLFTRLYTETQLPIYITEMDLDYSDDNQQLQAYQQYFPLFRDSGYVKGITIWGWIYGRTWSRAPNSGLVRNGTARPAMTWLMQQLGRPVP
jgi:endo-1,4-beta-xylanase